MMNSVCTHFSDRPLIQSSLELGNFFSVRYLKKIRTDGIFTTQIFCKLKVKESVIRVYEQIAHT